MKSHINLFNQFRSGILFFTLIFFSFQSQAQGFRDFFGSHIFAPTLSEPVFTPLVVDITPVDDTKKGVSGDLFIENCYQKIKLDGENQYRFLRSRFNITRTIGSSVGEYLRFQGFDEEGEEITPGSTSLYGGWALEDWVQSFQPWTVIEYVRDPWNPDILTPKTHFGWALVDMYTDDFGFAAEWYFDFLMHHPRVKTIKITDISYNEFLHEYSFGAENQTTLTIIDEDEILSTQIATTEGCLTYDEFKLNGRINLDGLCGKFRHELAEPLDGIGNYRIVSDEFELGDHVSFPDLDSHCWECLEMAAEPYPGTPGPMPCGCKEYVLKTTIDVCPQNEFDEGCSSLFLFQDIQICCECDIRDGIGTLN